MGAEGSYACGRADLVQRPYFDELEPAKPAFASDQERCREEDQMREEFKKMSQTVQKLKQEIKLKDQIVDKQTQTISSLQKTSNGYQRTRRVEVKAPVVVEDINKPTSPETVYQNIGKFNILNYQACCADCQVKCMKKFMDFTPEMKRCKCRGYGVNCASKLKKSCGWLCRHPAREWDLCKSCLGVGFAKKGDGFFSNFI